MNGLFTNLNMKNLIINIGCLVLRIQFFFNRKYGDLIRARFWKSKLKQFGEGSKVYGKIHITQPLKISIGKNCTINQGVQIYSRDKVYIGNNVRISANTIIYSGSLDINEGPPYIHYKEPVTIEDNVWLATSVIILPGVTIGTNSIIAANSVVTSNIPANVLAGGTPAKFIKTLNTK